MRSYQVVGNEEVVLCPGDNDMDDGNHNGCGVDFKCPDVNNDGDNDNTQAGYCQVVDSEEVVLCPGDNNMDADNVNTQAGHSATGGTLVGRICSVLQ